MTTSGVRSGVLFAACAAALAWGGCTGSAAKMESNGGSATPSTIGTPVTGMRRLSHAEFDNSLRDLLGETGTPSDHLPEDSVVPFDNDYQTQFTSPALITGAKEAAELVAAAVVADNTRWALAVPCTPTGPGDTECFSRFVASFGRKAFRRPLTSEELTAFNSLGEYGAKANDFKFAVRVALEAFLQHPAFLYRMEVGTPVDGKPGVIKLTAFEVAARLSYFLWGSTPPAWLLDAAETGFAAPNDLAASVQKMLEDDRASKRIQAFHAMWLNYQKLPQDPALAADMVKETNALVDEVYRGGGDQFAMFTADKTYVNASLATNYGLPFTGTGFQWVPYGTSGRRGILSQGSFLSQGTHPADSSPVLRGKVIMNTLLCRTVPAPPPNTPTLDMVSGGKVCKPKMFAQHEASPACAGCHKLMDPAGFGLENYDRQGRYRTTEEGMPECTISGEGSVAGLGNFKGPAELATLIAGSSEAQTCYVTNLFRIAYGRHETNEDAPVIQALADKFNGANRSLKATLLQLVMDPSFTFNTEE